MSSISKSRSGGRARRIPDLRVVLLDDLVREVQPVRDAKAFLALRSILREEKRAAGGDPLVVHTHSSKAGILGRAAARAAGADAVVHSIHGFGFHDGQSKPAHALYVGLERIASRWTDAFVAVSEENIRTGVREGIFRRERCRLIRSGFDTARFHAGSRAAGRKILGIPEGVPVVGTVAVFKPQKSPLDFVETARRVASEIPDSRFVMVGDGEFARKGGAGGRRDRDVGTLFVPWLASGGSGADGGLRRVRSSVFSRSCFAARNAFD